MLINVAQSQECRIALVDNGSLEELYIEQQSQASLVGSIFKGMPNSFCIWRSE